MGGVTDPPLRGVCTCGRRGVSGMGNVSRLCEHIIMKESNKPGLKGNNKSNSGNYLPQTAPALFSKSFFRADILTERERDALLNKGREVSSQSGRGPNYFPGPPQKRQNGGGKFFYTTRTNISPNCATAQHRQVRCGNRSAAAGTERRRRRRRRRRI